MVHASVLALFASVCMGGQALAVESGLRRARREADESAALAAVFVTIVVSVIIFWTLLLARGTVPTLTIPKLAPFVVAGILNPALLRLVYFEGIDRVGARISATVLAAYPAVAAMLAVGFLDESLGPALGGGIVCIIAGGALLQLTRRVGDDAEDLIVRELVSIRSRDVTFPVAATVLAAASYVLVRFGLTRFPDPIVATTAAQSAAFVVFLGIFAIFPTLRRQARVSNRGVGLAFIAAGVLIALFWLAQFYALRIGTVVTVVPLVSTFPLVVVGISYLGAGELPGSPRVIAGIALIIVGAVLVQAF